jgi:hypothetical protein
MLTKKIDAHLVSRQTFRVAIFPMSAHDAMNSAIFVQHKFFIQFYKGISPTSTSFKPASA